MKKNVFLPFLVIMLILSMVTISASQVSAAVAVWMSDSTVTLYEKESKKISANIAGGESNSSFKWSSSNNSVATVSKDGVIKAKKAGKATITAAGKNFPTKLTCKVTVKERKLKLNKSSATLQMGEELKLKTTASSVKGTLKWKSSNTKIATVSSDGVVTAVKNGSATITATLKGSSKTATVKIKVVKKLGKELEPYLGDIDTLLAAIGDVKKASAKDAGTIELNDYTYYVDSTNGKSSLALGVVKRSYYTGASWIKIYKRTDISILGVKVGMDYREAIAAAEGYGLSVSSEFSDCVKMQGTPGHDLKILTADGITVNGVEWVTLKTNTGG